MLEGFASSGPLGLELRIVCKVLYRPPKSQHPLCCVRACDVWQGVNYSAAPHSGAGGNNDIRKATVGAVSWASFKVTRGGPTRSRVPAYVGPGSDRAVGTKLRHIHNSAVRPDQRRWALGTAWPGCSGCWRWRPPRVGWGRPASLRAGRQAGGQAWVFGAFPREQTDSGRVFRGTRGRESLVGARPGGIVERRADLLLATTRIQAGDQLWITPRTVSAAFRAAGRRGVPPDETRAQLLRPTTLGVTKLSSANL